MESSPALLVAAGLAAGIFASAFVGEVPPWSHAGTAVKMDIGQVVDASGLVLEGRVLHGRSAESAEGGIFTDWEIAVDRTFWGDDQPSRTVRLPGGVLSDGKAMIVPGMPSLAAGEDVVLMLSDESEDGVRVPTGLSQGKYRIIVGAEGAKKAVRTGEHVTLASAAGKLSSGTDLSVLDYADLVSRLEAAAQAKRAGDPRAAAGATTADPGAKDR